jgi:hypothetical protein
LLIRQIKKQPRGNNLKKEKEDLWKTYEAIQELIRFADTKATAILAINGIIAGFYFSNFSALQAVWQQKSLAIIPLTLTIVFILISTVSSAYCIAPRLKMNNKKCLIFFCDIAEFESADDYEEALGDEKSNLTMEKQLKDQIWANSKIATRKYEIVNLCLSCFVLAIFSGLLFVLMNFWR